ncbi:DUF3597 domain-containing protein [Kutzneria buriramensis]|uniref:Uncharacterized protein n=1 Tax=Kutzneria buriramensis TaxID=1045776 RepID=A0A3E0GV81_9PSEU|nr:DUF3597 domain-containing protein [Kutzneria buriramensis]REH27068.1 hypothetical protein BCF44_13039 [Kutzneria buriramensis]
MAGPGSRPPWYVFALAALGVLLILAALIGFGPHSASAPAATPEPVPQPYRGVDTPTSTTTVESPTTATTVAPPSTTTRRVVGITTTAPPATTTTTTTTNPTRITISGTVIVIGPGNPTYCYGCGGSGGGGGHHW